MHERLNTIIHKVLDDYMVKDSGVQQGVQKTTIIFLKTNFKVN